MGYGPSTAGLDTGKRLSVGGRFTGAALVFQFFIFVFGNHRNRFVTQGIVRVFIDDHKYAGRTDRYAVPTAVAFFGINGDEKVARGIFVTVMCQHKILTVNYQKRIDLISIKYMINK
jgi:hypothetical protein